MAYALSALFDNIHLLLINVYAYEGNDDFITEFANQWSVIENPVNDNFICRVIVEGDLNVDFFHEMVR